MELEDSRPFSRESNIGPHSESGAVLSISLRSILTSFSHVPVFQMVWVFKAMVMTQKYGNFLRQVRLVY